MTARTMLGAVAALALTGTVHAELIEVGTFANVSNGNGDYQGAYGAFVTWITVEDGPVQIQLDISGLLDSLGFDAMLAVSVIDTGNNIYGDNSSGADIDLFALSNLWDDVETTWTYDGPTHTHQGESSSELAQRVAAIDAQGGVHEWGGPFHVSLGNLGALTATFSQPQGIQDDLMPPLAGTGEPIFLNLREAGVGESFRIQILATSIPVPGGLALLGVAALTGPRRRRRH